ncbi:MAG: Spy/CpxP family protein refolding chaperone [Pseudomonadales bacterium]
MAGILALLAAATASGQRGGMMDREDMEPMQQGMGPMQRMGPMMENCPCPMMQQRSGGMGRGMPMEGMMGPMGMGLEGSELEGVELTPQQRNQARELRQTHRQRHYERMARAMNLRDDLHAQMREEMPDPDTVQRLHARMAEVHGEMLADNVRLRNAIRGILTPEQRQALQQRRPGSTAAASEPDHDAHH